MNVTHREELDNHQVKLLIQIEADVWQKALADAYAENKAFFPVEGYALGAAPREALEAAYSQDILYQEAVSATFPAALTEAIHSQELLIAGTPQLNIISIGPEGYVFEAIIDLYPEVKLGQYKGLKAIYPATELSGDDVENALGEYLRAHMAEEHPDRAAMGDEVTLDFKGFVDGEAFEGGEGHDFPLVLGSGAFIPGFEEQVAGIRVGEERDVHVTFPLAYVPELAGKDAVFQVKAHAITRRTMPELNDAFAAAQGFVDAAALRRQIMETALHKKQAQAQDEFSDQLIRQVMDGMKVQVPASMVDNQVQGIIHELEQRLLAQGVELKQYLEIMGRTMETLQDEVRQNAETAARYELAMMEIVRLEHITVTEEDIHRQYTELSEMYGVSLQQLHQQLPPARISHDLKLQRARAVVVDSAIRG